MPAQSRFEQPADIIAQHRNDGKVEFPMEEKNLNRIIRMLPRAADVLRERVGAGNLGLRIPRSIVEARNILFASFGGRVKMRAGVTKPGERSYLIARITLNHTVLMEAAASAAGCVIGGSGGALHAEPAPIKLALPLLRPTP